MTSPFPQGTSPGHVQTSVTPTQGYASLNVVLTVQDVTGISEKAPWLTPAQRGELASYGGFQNAWLISWGDGASEVAGLASGAGLSVEVPHTYRFAGTFDISVISAQVATNGSAQVHVLQAVIPARGAARSSQVRFS